MPDQIKLFVEPQTPPMLWGPEEAIDGGFLKNRPPFSIALDGYVADGPRVNMGAQGPHCNFNHHERVNRLATRATCGQVLMAIRQGLFSLFHVPGEGAKAGVYVNDCDEDVCLSWFLLKHAYQARGTMNPLLNRLVSMEDALDATAGAYPYPADLPALREMAWIFEPYRLFRLSGGLDRKEPAAYRSVIEDVCGRIERHLVGRGSELVLDTRFERVGGGPGWTLVRETGAYAKTGMFSAGIEAYVAVRDRPGGRFTYTLGRMSPFIQFPLERLFDALNEAEAANGTLLERWGGGDTIGGSPRVAGSRLTASEVEAVVNTTIGAARA